MYTDHACSGLSYFSIRDDISTLSSLGQVMTTKSIVVRINVLGGETVCRARLLGQTTEGRKEWNA